MKKILFVCTGNTCRSPMAAAILKEMAEEKGLDIEVDSAGIFAFAGDRASREAIEVLKDKALDISHHRSKLVTDKLLEEADLVLTMTFSHKETLLFKHPFVSGKIYTLKEYAYDIAEDVHDPYGRRLKAYYEVENELRKVLEKVLDKIENEED